MFTFPYKLSDTKANRIFDQKYENFYSEEKLLFFKFLMIAICLTCFVALLIFTIQEQESGIVAFMASISSINFILIFLSHKFKLYLQHILALLYMFYVAAVSIIIVNGTQVPLFIHGYSSGILFSTIVQFCSPKFKIIFIVTTPWVFFAFADIYALSYLHFITYTISTSTLLGLMSYQFDNKQRQIYTLSLIIKQQQEIIKQITSDSLLAISYDEKKGQFKLEFANPLFENTYTEDIKEFLRTFQVVPDVDKKNTKLETLEEYFFGYNKKEFNYEENSYFNLKIKHKEKVQTISVIRTFFFYPIFVISIKSNKAEAQMEVNENKLQKLREAIISISSDTGSQLQSLYRSFKKVMESDCKNKPEICKYQQSNILSMLNRMKNYLIYFQQQKLQILNSSIECYQLSMFQKALLSYFEIKSIQRKRLFIYSTPPNFNEGLVLRLNQKLLTQILVNVFNVVLNASSIGSIIRLMVSQEECLNPKRFKTTMRTLQSNKEILNQQDIQYHQILQFKFTFTSDSQIDDLEQQLCKKQNDSIEVESMIVGQVNYIILRMIGPYNEIYSKSYLASDLLKYLNEVSFYVYTDQTRLDLSYIKQIQFGE